VNCDRRSLGTTQGEEEKKKKKAARGSFWLMVMTFIPLKHLLPSCLLLYSLVLALF
jgi:hypothetical protein